MLSTTDDLRIKEIKELSLPVEVMGEIPRTLTATRVVMAARNAIHAILNGTDDRLLVIVGPCSIHDPKAAIDYAGRLAALRERLNDRLEIVMRVYFEKPRTTVGWKGLINDPYLDETCQINEGLRRARRVLRDIGEMGMPCGTEFLDPITPQFTADLVAWGAIGARTTESQVHRQLASGLSMPIGFKNGTYGTVQLAVDGVVSAAHAHRFLGVTEQGLAAIVQTTGNPDCHVILRGGTSGTNYDAASVGKATELLGKAGLRASVMVDASHGNSSKDYRKQPDVVRDVARQVAGGSRGVFGVMMESFLVEGRQDLNDPNDLVYGQSITDACLSWEATLPLLGTLAEAVRERRKSVAAAE